MFRGRHCQQRIRAELEVIHQCGVGVFAYMFAYLLFELRGPDVRWGVILAPSVGAQIVYDVAETGEQDTLFAQWRKLLPELIMEVRCLRGINAELDDRNICLRKHMA